MLKLVLIILGIMLFVILAYYALIFFLLARMRSSRVIAHNVLVSADWLDVFPRPPLKVEHDVQHVYLAIEGCKYNSHRSLKPITLKDGTELNPEIQVLDEYGEVYNLQGLTVVGDLVGFSTHFPRDRVYTEVKIRNDKPFHCSKVYWKCSTNL
jgi:hypothetical protein